MGRRLFKIGFLGELPIMRDRGEDVKGDGRTESRQETNMAASRRSCQDAATTRRESRDLLCVVGRQATAFVSV